MDACPPAHKACSGRKATRRPGQFLTSIPEHTRAVRDFFFRVLKRLYAPPILNLLNQRAKKVVSDTQGLLYFAIGLVNSEYFGEIQITEEL